MSVQVSGTQSRVALSVVGRVWALLKRSGAIAAVLLSSSLLCAAAQIVPDGRWYEFSFTAAGTSASGCYPADPSESALECSVSSPTLSEFAPAAPWAFYLSSAAVLEVTDGFLYGDVFDIFDGDINIFSTTAVEFSGEGCGEDPAACSLDPLSSHGNFLLAGGSHSLTIVPKTIGDAGAGYFRITESESLPTPEPKHLAVIACGALVLSLFRLRAQKS